MLSGFNTNVTYRGVVFHVQTEDSGRANPHVITHLFHGGDILASEKRTYADKLESSNTDGEVRSLMDGQHRAMLTRLKEGHYDSGIEKRLGSDVWSASKGDVTEPASPKGAGDGSSETPKEILATSPNPSDLRPSAKGSSARSPWTRSCSNTSSRTHASGSIPASDALRTAGRALWG